MPSPAKPVPPAPDDLPRMSLLQHLEELRKRLVYSLIAVAVAFAGCWYYVEKIFDFIEKPIHDALPAGQKLAIFGIPDAFFLYFKVAGLAAVFLAAPVVLYQLWLFVAPGLYRRERRWAAAFVFAGTVLFVAGGLFAYYVASPFAIDFLLGMGSRFQPVIAVDRYLGFEMMVILGLGLMFELPVLIFTLSQIGVVTPQFLIRHFRWAVLLIFTLAAIVTPTPDVLNLCIFALPTIALYLLGVAAAWIAQRSRRRREATAAAGSTP